MAAAVAALAEPGEGLVPASTFALREGSGLSFSDAGEKELKVVDGRSRIGLLAEVRSRPIAEEAFHLAANECR